MGFIKLIRYLWDEFEPDLIKKTEWEIKFCPSVFFENQCIIVGQIGFPHIHVCIMETVLRREYTYNVPVSEFEESR